MRLTLAPISLRDANAWIDEVHRHHRPVTGHKFSVALVDESGALRAVGVAGRPKSRELQRQGYLEIVRIASDGADNACSMLYGTIRRAAVAMGYPAHKVVTYTLATEPGASLRAAGFVLDGITAGGSWDCPSRPREDVAPTAPKHRWLGGRVPL
ncbi:Uncharacterised protein [Streptococcus pyogenes]|nr:Uncharacterised protein [Streptococcus pyogenes]